METEIIMKRVVFFLIHFFVCFSESRGIYGKYGHFEAMQIFPKAMQSLLSVPMVTNVCQREFLKG